MRFPNRDILLGGVIAVILMLALSWCVNNPHSPLFWKSFP
jgi:hypothetical protein